MNVSIKFVNPVLDYLENYTMPNSSGSFEKNVWNGKYDIEMEKPLEFKIRFRNVNLNETTGVEFKIDSFDGSLVNTSDLLLKSKIKCVAIETNLSFDNITVEFEIVNYTSKISDYTDLRVFKCGEWNFTSRECEGTWQELTTTLDNVNYKVSATSSSTSSYLLAESVVCGDGVCDSAYGETSSNCPQDCGSTTTVVSGGGGGISSTKLKEVLEEILEKLKSQEKVVVRAHSISLEIYQGESTNTKLYVYNNYEKEMLLKARVVGSAAKFIDVINPVIRIPSGQEGYFNLKIEIPEDTKEGIYYGSTEIYDENFSATVPITIKVLEKPIKLLDLKIRPLQESIAPGDYLKCEAIIYSMGKGRRVDVDLTLMLLDVDTLAEVSRVTETLAVETSMSRILSLKVPKEIPEKKYLVKAVGKYISVDKEVEAVSTAYVMVRTPLLKKKFFGITLGTMLIVLLMFTSLTGVSVYAYRKKKEKEEKRRRYKEVVEIKELPKGGPNSAFVGLLAETGIRTFVNLDDLKMHVMIAGATGSGKTIAAMVLAEEALLKGKNVIVFDPTGQWTGFLRKCKEKHMLRHYRHFGMREGNARGFKGKIRIIEDPTETTGLKELISSKEPKITVFVLNKLNPEQLDLFVANTIQEVFDSHLEESTSLRALLVYDEVHRLLTKFGGSGKGFVAIEKGVREFRKWGIGLILISQVLSDFVGEIKANIGTEIQMRTRYEGDLERIRMKYGENFVLSVVKASVGTGMFVFSEYNKGKPYFISFRPILHQVTRLSDKELEEYDKRDRKIEELKFYITKLKRSGVDVFDLETELKLAESKLAQGAFEVVDIYLEGIEPRIRKEFERHKIKIPKFERIKKAKK